MKPKYPLSETTIEPLPDRIHDWFEQYFEHMGGQLGSYDPVTGVNSIEGITPRPKKAAVSPSVPEGNDYLMHVPINYRWRSGHKNSGISVAEFLIFVDYRWINEAYEVPGIELPTHTTEDDSPYIDPLDETEPDISDSDHDKEEWRQMTKERGISSSELHWERENSDSPYDDIQEIRAAITDVLPEDARDLHPKIEELTKKTRATIGEHVDGRVGQYSFKQINFHPTTVFALYRLPVTERRIKRPQRPY